MKEDFKNGTEKLDIKLLERLIKETTSATDRMGTPVVYFIPLKEEFTDVCQYILSKHGINMAKYQSSLNKYPVLKISFSDIDKLSEPARNFLFAVNVNPKQLDAHLNNIMKEMQSNKR